MASPKDIARRAAAAAAPKTAKKASRRRRETECAQLRAREDTLAAEAERVRKKREAIENANASKRAEADKKLEAKHKAEMAQLEAKQKREHEALSKRYGCTPKPRRKRSKKKGSKRAQVAETAPASPLTTGGAAAYFADIDRRIETLVRRYVATPLVLRTGQRSTVGRELAGDIDTDGSAQVRWVLQQQDPIAAARKAADISPTEAAMAGRARPNAQFAFEALAEAIEKQGRTPTKRELAAAKEARPTARPTPSEPAKGNTIEMRAIVLDAPAATKPATRRGRKSQVTTQLRLIGGQVEVER